MGITTISGGKASKGGATSADKVSYNNTESGLQATTVQGAIDEVGANLGEYGVISQTTNWSGNNTDGYTYRKTNIVRGIIPQSFIDRWDRICKYSSYRKQGKFNKETGYFEANELTDISYEEAIQIVDLFAGKSSSNTGANFSMCYIGDGPRTTLDIYSEERKWGDGFQRPQFTYLLVRSDIEILYIVDTTLKAEAYRLVLANCYKVRKVLGALDCTAIVSGSINMGVCNSLTDIRLKNIKVSVTILSPHLSLETIVYAVQNSYRALNPTATTTLTIHLGEQAYNRCFDDETEYTWNGQTYYGILELADAVGVSIVYP